MYYFFFSKTECQRYFHGWSQKKGTTKESDISKSINFEDIIENELDFHGYGTANIEIQQQLDDVNPFTYELREISYRFYNKITCHSAIPSICVRSICFYLANLCSQGLVAF